MLLRTRRGTATFRAQVSEDIRADTVFVPFHWGGASAANALTDPSLDPQSKMPAFKVCAVAVTRVSGPTERIQAPAPAHRPRPHAALSTPVARPPSRRRTTSVKSTPRFLQGVYPITGEGLSKPGLLDPALRYQVEFNNTMRWLSWDLLCGRVDDAHPLRGWLLDRAGAGVDELAWFVDNPCPPDVLGANHYVTSERWLDLDMTRWPARSHGGNGRHRYADMEAVRCFAEPTPAASASASEDTVRSPASASVDRARRYWGSRETVASGTSAGLVTADS